MPIAIRVMTLVIKKQALDERFPGGVDGFRALHPGPADEFLAGVRCMSGGEIGEILDLLRSLGLDLPSCCAIGDVHLGPLETCPGIEFYALTPDARYDSNWYAAATGTPPGRTAG
jgi:hypothetical protein